ncbi:MAG: hypothetical protein AB8D78_11705 [Akkermansiaceae bacterium]
MHPTVRNITAEEGKKKRVSRMIMDNAPNIWNLTVAVDLQKMVSEETKIPR